MAGQYRFKDQNGNIVAQISASVGGAIAFSGSVVDFSQANNVILGNVQLAGTASNALLLDGFDSQAFAFTSSIHPFTASIAGTNTFTSSAKARLDSIETISASNVSRLDSLEIKTGSLATTGSNTFIGTQTITGSLFISSNLIVQGTSSLQNITASAVSIGTNIVNLNTANPAIRYAGLVIGDSGSVGSSGSFLYDSVQDEMIFVHRGANTTVTSSVVLMGPETYDNIGSEVYPTSNRIQKGTGNEHLVDSCITDSGTLITINSTTQINNCLGVSGNLTVNRANADARLLICQTSSSDPYTATIELSSQGVGTYGGLVQYDAGPEKLTIQNYGRSSASSMQGGIAFRTKLNNTTPTDILSLNGFTGVACFSSTICSPLVSVNSAVRLYGNGSGIGCAYIVTTTGANEQPAIILEKAGGYGNSEIRTYYNDVPNYGVAFRVGSTTGVYINSSGYLGVGTSSPLTSFTVKSTNDNGYALTRPSDASSYHWRLSTTETGGDAYTVRYNTFNNEMIFSTYSGGGTGGNIIFRTSTTGGSETERFRINCHGIATYSCQICASGLYADGSTTSGTVIRATQNTNPDGCAMIIARWSGDTGMRMIYHPNSAIGVIENTYQISAGHPFGDILFRQNSSGTPVTRLRLQADGGIAHFSGTVCAPTTVSNVLAITTPALHGMKTFDSGATSAYTINLPAEFPNGLLTVGNVWGVIGKALFFNGGQAEVRDFYIARNSGGSWSNANYGPQAVTSSGILQSVVGSGTCIVINMNASSYVTVELTAMIR